MSLQRPTFPTVRLAEGYDTDDVDRAVDMALDNLALAQPRIGRGDIEALRFSPVRMRPGYTMSAVDDWFDEVAVELDRRSGAPAPARPAPSQPVPTPYAPTATEPVHEQPDWMLALILVTITLVVTVLVYTSRF
ncbi:MAG TPA: hypothetical protein VLK03_10820 [Nocardioides sp.]|nr:hypothetical protein [Nocardioides sp.]